MGEEEDNQDQARGAVFAFRLLVLGFLLMFIGVIVVIAAAFLQAPSGQSSASGAVVIFVGPIPIILGVGPDSFYAIVLAFVLTIIGFVVFFLMRRQLPKS